MGQGWYQTRDPWIYISNTIILYFIVHCMYVLCLFSAWHASLTPHMSGLRCIVFNKDLFCSVASMTDNVGVLATHLKYVKEAVTVNSLTHI